MALERPGNGLSAAQRSWGLLDWTADVTPSADWLRLERLAVIGISRGGKYAAACAYALPEHVNRAAILVLASGFASRAESLVYWANDDSIGRAKLNGTGANQRFSLDTGTA